VAFLGEDERRRFRNTNTNHRIATATPNHFIHHREPQRSWPTGYRISDLGRPPLLRPEYGGTSA
jgi:hypothetical protein